MAKVKQPNQQQRILNYIRANGSIDRVKACYNCGIFELSSRIVSLEKKGYVFGKKRITGISKRFNEVYACVEYSLVKDLG